MPAHMKILSYYFVVAIYHFRVYLFADANTTALAAPVSYFLLL